jgi:hypothetical protein
LASIACPSTTFCVAVDDGPNAVQGDPSAGGGWTVAPIRGADPLTGVSCSSLSRCVAVGASGDAYVGPGGVTIGSYAKLAGIVNGHPELSLRLNAPQGGPKIHAITIRPTNGLKFSGARHASLDGIVVTTRAGRVKLGASVGHRNLTITLATPTRTAHILLSEPAITVTRTLAREVRAGKLKTFPVSLTATNTDRSPTRMALNAAIVK